MAQCIECSFLLKPSEKSNYICSIEKIRTPTAPGLYVKNPKDQACLRNFRRKTDYQKEKK